MFRALFASALAAATLVVAPVTLRPGAESAASAHAASVRGELVGKVVNRSSRYMKRRLQVRVGNQEWTLHVPEGTPVVSGRKPYSIHDLEQGTYIRAIGQRIGRTRLRADHVYIIGDRLALQRSGYGRRGGDRGYFATYAGYRQQYRR